MAGSLRIGFCDEPGQHRPLQGEPVPAGQEAHEIRGGEDGSSVDELHRGPSYGGGVPPRLSRRRGRGARARRLRPWSRSQQPPSDRRRPTPTSARTPRRACPAGCLRRPVTPHPRGAPPRISVRRATPSHAPAIRAIADAAWRATYRDLLRPETVDWFLDRAYSEERVALRIERHETWVAELADEVAAFAESAIEPDRVTLVAIYADPDRRGLGLGSALLDAITSAHPDLPGRRRRPGGQHRRRAVLCRPRLRARGGRRRGAGRRARPRAPLVAAPETLSVPGCGATRRRRVEVDPLQQLRPRVPTGPSLSDTCGSQDRVAAA